jgi:uncharacterized membrane protein YfcA
MMLIVLTLLMLAVAIVFSMLGLGGGVLYTPIQVWAGIEFHVAAATSLFLMMVVSLSASLVFRRAKKIDWPLALLLEAVTMVGGFLGGLSSARFSGSTLTGLFAVVVVVAGICMIRPVPEVAPKATRGRGILVWQRSVGDQLYHVHLGVALPLSFIAGLLSGMVGVGGGILKVPMMVLLLGVPLDIAIGSSAVMIGLTAAAGFAGHVVNGHWDWRQSLVLAAAVFVGGQIGSRISVQLNKKKLKRGFGWFLMFVAAAMLARLRWGM